MSSACIPKPELRRASRGPPISRLAPRLTDGATIMPRPCNLLPPALIADLPRTVRNRPGRHDFDGAPQLHDVTDSAFDHAPGRIGVDVRLQLETDCQRVLMAFAPDDHLVAGDAHRPGDDLVGL